MSPLAVDCVIKVGGGMFARADTFNAVIAEISLANREAALLIVPGGGPLPTPSATSIDRSACQTTLLIGWRYWRWTSTRTSLRPGCRVAKSFCGPDEIESALKRRRIPVLAPYQWLRDVDPLPHSWDVTSDSISAWVAGQVGAARLVLVKPSGASGPDIVDRASAVFCRLMSPRRSSRPTGSRN